LRASFRVHCDGDRHVVRQVGDPLDRLHNQSTSARMSERYSIEKSVRSRRRKSRRRSVALVRAYLIPIHVPRRGIEWRCPIESVWLHGHRLRGAHLERRCVAQRDAESHDRRRVAQGSVRDRESRDRVRADVGSYGRCGDRGRVE